MSSTPSARAATAARTRRTRSASSTASPGPRRPRATGWSTTVPGGAVRAFVERHLPGLDPEPVSRDELPVHDDPRRGLRARPGCEVRGGRVVIASPCSGHGAKFAPLVGVLVADLVEGAAPPALRLPRRCGSATAMPDPIVLPRLTRVRGATARSTTWWGRALVRSFEELTVEATTSSPRGPWRDRGASARSWCSRRWRRRSWTPGSDGPADGAGAGRPSRRGGDGRPSPRRPPGRAGYVAALEAGELPAELVEHADEAGAELLPGPGDIDTACECDAWGQPCVHALALLYQLAWQVDRDPYVLLLLRGRTREDAAGGGERPRRRALGTRGRGARAGPHPGGPGARPGRGRARRPRAGRRCRGGVRRSGRRLL